MAQILIVDDSPDIRGLLANLLMAEGHRVATAEDGHDAIQRIGVDHFDLVVLDVMMPKQDGYSVLKEMRRSGLRDEMKIVMLTAKSGESDWARGYTLGADDYITKPFEVDELLASVARLLSMSKEQIRSRREQELDRARLLSRLQSLLGDV